MRVALITPSFSRDHDLCAELCRSVDTYDRDRLEHVVIVPRSDFAQFRHLAGGRRRVVRQEDVLPARLMRLPLPQVVAIPGLWHKRLRKLWITQRLKIVRGWVLQQVLKLSADKVTDADGYVFLDSDCVMIRPFGTDTFVRNGRMPLHFAPGRIDHHLERYARWQDVACDLTGLPRTPYAGDNFIATVVCWRRDRLREILARIAAVGGMDPQATLLAQQHLSEYVVYGVWCTRGVGGDSGHTVTAEVMCHEDWNYDMTCAAGRAAFEAGLKPHHVAVLIQSTNEWPIERRRATVAAIRRAARLA